MENNIDLINEVEQYLNNDNINFEKLLDYLNKIVDSLDNKDVDLTNSVKLYTLGVKVGHKLNTMLALNEQLVEKTMKELSQKEIEEKVDQNN